MSMDQADRDLLISVATHVEHAVDRLDEHIKRNHEELRLLHTRISQNEEKRVQAEKYITAERIKGDSDLKEKLNAVTSRQNWFIGAAAGVVFFGKYVWQSFIGIIQSGSPGG